MKHDKRRQDDRSREVKVYEHTLRYIREDRSLKPFAGEDYCMLFWFSTIPLPVPLAPESVMAGTIVVENTDTLSMAARFSQESGQVCILNMASSFKPGGGVVRGARSQEENIARRSNLVAMLDQQMYPIPSTAMLYSPRVTVFKDADYNLLNERFVVSVLTCAAIRNPKLNREGLYHEDQSVLMYNKIRGMILLAIHFKQRRLVLGAFGCGAFNNPPREVASLFHHCLMDEGLASYFEKVGFAVLVGRSNEQENLAAFQEVFCSK